MIRIMAWQLYYYTKDIERMIRVYEALEYGIIGCNDAVPAAEEGPFGGMKQSGGQRGRARQPG